MNSWQIIKQAVMEGCDRPAGSNGYNARLKIACKVYCVLENRLNDMDGEQAFTNDAEVTDALFWDICMPEEVKRLVTP